MREFCPPSNVIVVEPAVQGVHCGQPGIECGSSVHRDALKYQRHPHGMRGHLFVRCISLDATGNGRLRCCCASGNAESVQMISDLVVAPHGPLTLLAHSRLGCQSPPGVPRTIPCTAAVPRTLPREDAVTKSIQSLLPLRLVFVCVYIAYLTGCCC